jgi:outer membrane protein assembly factor BamB
MPVFYRGRVFVTAGGDVWWGKNEAWLKCVDAASGALVWSYTLERHSMCTPAIADGLVFVVDSGQKIHCVDAASGAGIWTHDAGGEMWASPLVADGKVFIGTRRGDFVVLAASREKNLLGVMKLGNPTHSTAAAANGTLFVATMKKLFALEKAR